MKRERDRLFHRAITTANNTIAMSSSFAKAAVGALAMQGGGENVGRSNSNSPNNSNYNVAPENPDKSLPVCPFAETLPKYHEPDACGTKPSHRSSGHIERESIYERLKFSGSGATLVPDQKTIICPLEVQSLEQPGAVKGFDTTWIVENTSSTEVVISWVVDGVEWSPFKPDVKAIDDPKARLKPGEWQSVPTFESFVYVVREMLPEGGGPGDVLLQHRAGMVPIGNPRNLNSCQVSNPDVEPVNPETADRKPEFKRTPTHKQRPCNTIDIGFRNQAQCPLHVYWANRLGEDGDVPEQGFNCGEKFKFHLGTKPATQDFMFDWESQTKFEGTYIGHTFVARLASNPDIVVDSYTLEPTRIIDCPNMKQKVAPAVSHQEAEAIIGAEGTIQPLGDSVDSTIVAAAAAAAAGMS